MLFRSSSSLHVYMYGILFTVQTAEPLSFAVKPTGDQSSQKRQLKSLSLALCSHIKTEAEGLEEATIPHQ